MLAVNNTSEGFSLLSTALELIWPTRCAGCEKPGSLLCDDCKRALVPVSIAEACVHCGAPFGRRICTECYSSEGKEQFSFTRAVSCVEMDELSGRIIVLYKDNNEHRLAEYVAHELYSTLPPSWLQWADVLTWIPADKKALRRRGFDHMERIAKHLATLTNLPAQQLLQKLPGRDQRSLNREERRINLERSLSLAANLTAIPPRCLLIDDVFTTGVTLDTAAALLKAGGAQEVRVASFARVW